MTRGSDAPKRSSFRFAPTPLGVIVLAIGVAAALVGMAVGEVAALIAAFPLAFILVSGISSAWRLRSLRASLAIPSAVYAARLFPARVTLRIGTPARDAFLQLGPGGRSMRDVSLLRRIVADRDMDVAVSHRIAMRGRVTSMIVALRSSFPFGLFESRSAIELPVDLIVYPATAPLRRLDDILKRASRTAQLRPAGWSRGEEEFRSLRNWRPGEPRRMIAWKPSARRGGLLMRELEEPKRPPILLRLDARLYAGSSSFELAVRLCASLIEAFHREGHRVRLDVIGGSRELSEEGNEPDRREVARMLETLATVQAEKEPTSSPAASGRSREGSESPTDDRGDGGARRPVARDRHRDETVVRVRAGGEQASSETPGEILLDVDRESVRRWLAHDCGWSNFDREEST